MPPGIPGRKTAPQGVHLYKTYEPTMEEFRDFRKFIEKIEDEDQAHLAGIVKIKPPKEWIPRKAGYGIETFSDIVIDRPTKQRFHWQGDRGAYQSKGLIQPKMNVEEYYKMTQSDRYKTPQHDNYDKLEQLYWKSLNFKSPIYGCDVATEISDSDLKEWRVANLDSILKVVAEETGLVFPGINSAYVYFGMWKATFAWHSEDMDLYSINFNHYGAPKTWYCVPPEHGHLLEKACRELFPNASTWCNNFMRHKSCVVGPKVLDRYGVPYQKVIQEGGDIIIVFPYAYHSGFNHGFNIAESTNFALERWIEYGKRQNPCDCDRARVKFSMDPFVKKYQPHLWEDWKSGKDIQPHPEDPPEIREKIKQRIENPEAYEKEIQKKMERKLKTVEKRKKHQQQKMKTEESNEVQPYMVHVYRHVEHPEVEIELDSKDFKICRGIEKLKAVLPEQINVDTDFVKKLIEKEVLYRAPLSRQIKRKAEPKEDATNSVPIVIKEDKVVNMFKHVALEGVQFTADPVTLDFTEGFPPNQATVDFFNQAGMTIKEMFDLGVFVKIGDCNMTVERLEKQQTPAKKIKLDPEKIDEEYLHVYWHQDSNSLIHVDPKTKKIIKEEDTKDLVEDMSVEELVDEGKIAYVALKKMKNVEENTDKKPKILPKKEIKEEIDILEKQDEKKKAAQLNRDDEEEEDNNSITQNDFNEHDELLDDDDEDLYTSDESSESADSSDGDYRGSGGIADWKEKRSTKTSRMKRRRELDERLAARRARGDGKRGYRKSGKHAGRKRGEDLYDPTVCFEVAKKFLDTNILPENSHFTIRQLIEKEVGNSSGIAMVLRVLRGFKFVQKIGDTNEGAKYKWKGIKKDRYKDIIWKVFEDPDSKTDDVVWNIACDMLRVLASSRKNIRVYLPLIAKFYKVDESARIQKVSAVLEALGLVELKTDDLGGVIYRGPDVYQDFCHNLHLKYAEIEHFKLKNFSLELDPVEIKPEYLYEIEPPKFEIKEEVDLNSLDLDEEKKRSLLNKDKVCMCGFKKELKGAVAISRIGNKTQNRSRVLVGGKRKKRCKNCDGCLAKPCRSCQQCLNPHLKKPCELRVCQFPIVPDCPCFR